MDKETLKIGLNRSTNANFAQTFKAVQNFNNLNVKDLTENKHFWKIIKPFFTEKTKATNNMILTEKQ